MNFTEKILNESNKIFNEKQEILGDFFSLKERLKEKIDKFDPSTYEYSEKSIGKVEAYKEILEMITEIESRRG